MRWKRLRSTGRGHEPEISRRRCSSNGPGVLSAVDEYARPAPARRSRRRRLGRVLPGLLRQPVGSVGDGRAGFWVGARVLPGRCVGQFRADASGYLSFVLYWRATCARGPEDFLAARLAVCCCCSPGLRWE